MALAIKTSTCTLLWRQQAQVWPAVRGHRKRFTNEWIRLQIVNVNMSIYMSPHPINIRLINILTGNMALIWSSTLRYQDIKAHTNLRLTFTSGEVLRDWGAKVYYYDSPRVLISEVSFSLRYCLRSIITTVLHITKLEALQVQSLQQVPLIVQISLYQTSPEQYYIIHIYGLVS